MKDPKWPKQFRANTIKLEVWRSLTSKPLHTKYTQTTPKFLSLASTSHLNTWLITQLPTHYPFLNPNRHLLNVSKHMISPLTLFLSSSSPPFLEFFDKRFKTRLQILCCSSSLPLWMSPWITLGIDDGGSDTMWVLRLGHKDPAVSSRFFSWNVHPQGLLPLKTQPLCCERPSSTEIFF